MMLHAPGGWGDRLNVKDNSMQKKEKSQYFKGYYCPRVICCVEGNKKISTTQVGHFTSRQWEMYGNHLGTRKHDKFHPNGPSGHMFTLMSTLYNGNRTEKIVYSKLHEKNHVITCK